MYMVFFFCWGGYGSDRTFEFWHAYESLPQYSAFLVWQRVAPSFGVEEHNFTVSK